jgi:hypothetical protein
VAIQGWQQTWFETSCCYELLAGDPSTPTSKDPPRQGAFNGLILNILVKVRNEGFAIEALKYMQLGKEASKLS